MVKSPHTEAYFLTQASCHTESSVEPRAGTKIPKCMYSTLPTSRLFHSLEVSDTQAFSTSCGLKGLNSFIDMDILNKEELGMNDSCSPSSLHFSFLSLNKLTAAGGVFVQDTMASFDQQLPNLPARKSGKLCWLYKMFNMDPRTRNTASKAVEPPLPESYVFMLIPSAEDGNFSWYPEPSLIFHTPRSFIDLNTLHLTQCASIVTETPKGNKATVSSGFLENSWPLLRNLYLNSFVKLFRFSALLKNQC